MMFDSLPFEVTQHLLTFTAPSTLVSFRSVDKLGYEHGTLAIFEGTSDDLRELRLSLLQGWLVDQTGELTKFLQKYEDKIITILTRHIHDKKSTSYEKLIYLLSLRLLLDPDFKVPKEQIANSALKVDLDEAALKTLGFAYLLSPELTENKHFDEDISTAIMSKLSYSKRPLVNESILTKFGVALAHPCIHGWSPFKTKENTLFLNVLRVISPYLSPDEKQFLSSVITSQRRSSRNLKEYATARLDALELLLKPVQNSEETTQWLVRNVSTDHNPFIPLLLETIDDNQARRVLLVIAEYNYNYYDREVNADTTKDFFYSLLLRVSEGERVDILIKILEQDFRTTAGYVEYMPRYIKRFFGGLIKESDSFDKILNNLTSLPETNEEESHEKYVRLQAFYVFLPMPITTYDLRHFSGTVEHLRDGVRIYRFLDGQPDPDTLNLISDFRANSQLDRLENLTPEILKQIHRLNNPEDRSFIFDKLLDIEELHAAQGIRMSLGANEAVEALLPYQGFFNELQNERILKQITMFNGQTWDFCVLLLDHYSSFTPSFKQRVKDIIISDLSRDPRFEGEPSVQVVNAFLSNQELCTRENLAILEKNLTEKCLGRVLIDNAKAVGKDLYKWQGCKSNSPVKLS